VLFCCRLLLTQDSQDCFVLIMDVVRQVVRAAQDHIDSKRASSAGKKKSVGVVTYIVRYLGHWSSLGQLLI